MLAMMTASVSTPMRLRRYRTVVDKCLCFKILLMRKGSGALAYSAKARVERSDLSVPSTESKFSRANAVTPLFEAGRIMLPDRAPWLQCWIDEHVAFGVGAGAGKTRKDDRVDHDEPTSLALARMQTSKPRPLYVGSLWGGSAPDRGPDYGDATQWRASERCSRFARRAHRQRVAAF
jgi:hypothetical protein